MEAMEFRSTALFPLPAAGVTNPVFFSGCRITFLWRFPLKKSALFAMALALVAALSLHSAKAQDSAAPSAMPTVGQTAPTFSLPSQDGTAISLDQYRGKWVVLYFYPKDMTTGCTIEAHNFQNAQDQFAAKNAVILGVSVDSTDSHKQFCAKDGLTFHLLSDTSHNVVSSYGSLGNYNGISIANRNTFLIDPTGKIAQVWTKVNPATAASSVLDAIPAAGSTPPPTPTGLAGAVQPQ
jgi:thioredoxin-dependent peroxiredoxin